MIAGNILLPPPPGDTTVSTCTERRCGLIGARHGAKLQGLLERIRYTCRNSGGRLDQRGDGRDKGDKEIDYHGLGWVARRRWGQVGNRCAIVVVVVMVVVVVVGVVGDEQSRVTLAVTVIAGAVGGKACGGRGYGQGWSGVGGG